MRGHRVHPFDGSDIADIAARVCKAVGMRKRSFNPKHIELFIGSLELYGINIDPVEDDEWIDVTRATVDPQKGMIYMPGRLYSDLCRGKAEAIRIFLHELGHIFLCHKPLLHYSDAAAKMEQDSEWQADYFADAIIAALGLPKKDHQLELQI